MVYSYLHGSDAAANIMANINTITVGSRVEIYIGKGEYASATVKEIFDGKTKVERNKSFIEITRKAARILIDGKHGTIDCWQDDLLLGE